MAKAILIIDSSASIREVVSFTLENEGYRVLMGVDGKDALKFLDGQDIDLVITDLNLPEIDGIRLIKDIRKMEKYQRIPILFFTTESQSAKKKEAKEAGATGWIIKPFVPAKLLEVIKIVLR